MTWRALWCGGAAALALALAPAPARAFCRTVACPPGARCAADARGCPTGGPPLFWRTACVGYSFQGDLSAHYPRRALRDAVRRGLAAWVDVECPGGGRAGITFVERADVSCDRVEFNEGGPNANVILFQDDEFEYKSAFNTLARTVVTYDLATGEITGADLEINSAYNHFSLDAVDPARTDLQALIAHEAGHFLGLAHTQEENEDATMVPFIGPGDAGPRTLSPDDVAGLCAAYPPDAARERCDPEPWGGASSDCGAAPDGCAQGGGRAAGRGAGAFAALAVALAAARRRRPAAASGGAVGRHERPL
ncbi:MAG TPA: matrixin family metalloprotease [Polyangiaceae bacterium]|nr:matrixin family metalloprotease [Polyangiaceae bacterium]